MTMTGISSLQQSAPAAAMAAITANRVWPRSNQYRIATRKSIVKKSMKISCRRKREKIDHVRRYGDEECCNQRLVFIDVPDPVNA